MLTNEQRAIWSGLTKVNSTDLFTQDKVVRWFYPEGKKLIDLPDYAHDLNACVRDFVPKLKQRQLKQITFDYYGKHGETVACTLFFEDFIESARGLIEAAAFTAAVDKIIQSDTPIKPKD